MITCTHIAELRSRLAPDRGVRSVGFVPTMGALHDGHLSLIRKAKQENDVVVLSVFVNPTQFAPTEDLERYPRNVERDAGLAEHAGCDIIFVPSVNEMYPEGFSTYVQVEGLSSVLEGAFRPTHFKGVTTVVLKLLNIVQPGTVYFGQKDVQQSIVIRTMVRDLDVPVHIEVVPTMREADGLAMSSRNVYLDPVRRKNAPVLYAALQHASAMIAAGERDPRTVIGAMEKMIREKDPTTIDYITIVDAGNLAEKQVLSAGDTVVIPLAVRFGTTRLIDNIVISIPT